MDERIAARLDGNSGADFPHDVLHLHDYRDPSLAPELFERLKGYRQRLVVAWSLGVWAASRAGLTDIARAIAINGTLDPVHTVKGIDPNLFQATLDGYDDDSRARFMRRICGGASGLREFAAMAPQRSATDQRQELAAIRQQILAAAPVARQWRYQHAIIGARDLIFTEEAQRRAWADTPQTVVGGMPHVPFFAFDSWQEILSCPG
jgi:biotin synthesis protein BioG